MLRVLVIDESRTRAAEICAGLALAGHQVAAVLPSAIDLVKQVEATRPDIILIETDSPTRDTLEHLSVLDRANPRPIVMFTQDADSQAIREAVQAGVSAYVVDGLDVSRIKPVIDVAVAQFESHQALRNELAESNRKLSERKTVDRAKGTPDEGAFAVRGGCLSRAAQAGDGARQDHRGRLAGRHRHGEPAALNAAVASRPRGAFFRRDEFFL